MIEKKKFWKIVPNCEQLDDWYESIKMENNFSLNTWKINSQEDLLFFFLQSWGFVAIYVIYQSYLLYFVSTDFPTFHYFHFFKITFHSIIQLHFKHETYSKCSCIFFFITHCKYREKNKLIKNNFFLFWQGYLGKGGMVISEIIYSTGKCALYVCLCWRHLNGA